MPGIFISYSSSDKTFVHKLAVDLLNEAFPVWLDALKIELGDSLIDKIYTGVDDSTYFLLIISQYSIKSGWVNKELNASLTKEEELGRPFIIPIVVERCEIPLKVRDRIFVDFSELYMKGLEQLVYFLKQKRLHEITVPTKQILIPIKFTKGIFLNKSQFARWTDTCLSFFPRNYRVDPAQLILAPDKNYDELRYRLLNRMEHLVEEAQYSPELESLLNSVYQGILNFEDKLRDGLSLLINEIGIAGRLPFLSLEECCFWFAKIVRTRVLCNLWSAQVPNDPERIDYGKSCCGMLIGDSESTARLFEVERVTLCNIFPNVFQDIMTNFFTAWVDSEDKCVKETDLYSQEVMEICSIKAFDKYLVPQMVYHYILGHSTLITWDFNNYLIGN